MPSFLASSILSFFSDHLALVVSFVLVLVMVIVLAPEVFGQMFGSLGNIGRYLNSIFTELWGLWCKLTFIPWKFVDTFRAIFFSTTLGILALGTLHIIVESVPVAHALTEEFPQLSPWVARARDFLVQHEPSFQADLALLALAILVFWHTIVEFFRSLRREEIPKFLGELAIQFDKFRKDFPNPNEKAKSDYLQELMRNTTTLLDKKGRRKILISIMGEETTKDTTGKDMKTGFLKVDPVPPGNQLDASLRLRVEDQDKKEFRGEGAAGRAFCHQAPVYIPKVFYQVGIRLDTVRSLGPTYVESKDARPLRSILSVPVLIRTPVSGSPKPAIQSVAVISAASLRSHAFTRDDVRMLELVAVFISRLY